MAEKVTLFELNIDTKALVKANADVKKSVDELTKGVKELKKEEQENNKAIDEAKKKLAELKDERIKDTEAIKEAESELDKLLNKRTEVNEALIDQQTILKVNQKQLRQNNKLITDSIEANEAQSDSIEQLRKQLAVVSVQWAKLSKEERENTKRGKELAEQKKQLTAELKKEEKATGDTRRNVGNYTDSILEAIEGQETFGVSLANIRDSFTSVTGAIGAGVAVLAGLTKAYASSARGAEDLARASDRLGSITRGLGNLIADATGEVSLFDSVVRAFQEQLLGLQSATLSDIEVNTKAQLRRLEVLNLEQEQRKKEQLNEAEILRQTRDDERNSFEERQQANERLAEVIKEREEETIKFQEEKLKLYNTLLALDNENIEVQQQIKRLEFEIADAREEAQGFISEQRTNDLALFREFNENQLILAQRRIEGEILLTKEGSEERLNLEKQLIETTRVLQLKAAGENSQLIQIANQEALNAETALLQQYEKLREAARLKELEAEEAFAAEEAAQAIEDLKNQLALEESLRAQSREREEDARQREITNRENELAIAEGNVVRQLEIQRQGLEAQKAQELEFAQAIGADTLLINEKFAKANEALDRAQFQAKAELAAGFAGDIAQIAGEQTAIGKAAAIAETTINTYKSATASYSSLAGIPVVGPALGAAAAGAAIAAGIKNVQEILKVDSGLPGDTGGGSSISGGAVPNVSAPQVSAPQVNEGIISRETIVQETQEPQTIVAIPTDNVTIKQQQTAANNNTSVL